MMKWYPVELHTHSIHSDGDFTVEELVRAAKRDGYAALALTDHNTSSGVNTFCAQAKAQGIVPVRGLEWTTYWGHMVVLEEQGYTDWRGVRPEQIDQAIRSIHAHHGIVGIAHPYSLSDPVNTGYHWAFQIEDWSQVDYLEVWSRNYAPYRIQSQRAFELWENLLNQGYHITAMTGRDWHRDDRLPCCYTWIGVENVLTEDSIVNAIRNGRVCLSAGPLLTMKVIQDAQDFFPGECALEEMLCVKMEIDFRTLPEVWDREQIVPREIRLICDGETVKKFPVFQEKGKMEAAHFFEAAGRWLRADLYGDYYGVPDCRIAVTNPVYLKNASYSISKKSPHI